MRKLRGSVVAAVTAALVLTSFNVDVARAAQPAGASAQGAAVATTDNSATWDLSARKRYRRHHNNAAAVAAVIGVFGTIAALAAADRHRHRHYYYDDRPYYGPHYYYGPRPGYRHYRWHHHW